MSHRVLLAGCGSIALGWAKALRDSPDLAGTVETVGLAHLGFRASQRLRDISGLADVRIETDLSKMPTVAKCELLFNVLIPKARRGVKFKRLARGSHVLSRKPMAMSRQDARRTHAVLQNRSCNPGERRIRCRVLDGLLDTLTATHADFFTGAHFGGFQEHLQNVPLTVYCRESNPMGSWNVNGAAANAKFALSDGAAFTCRGSWVADGPVTSSDCTWRIVETKGTLLWDMPPTESGGQTHGDASVTTELLMALEANHPPETAESGNINMVFGAIAKARAGVRVEIST